MRPPAGTEGLKAVPCVNNTQNSKTSVASPLTEVQFVARWKSSSFVVVAVAASSACAPAATAVKPTAAMSAAWSPVAVNCMRPTGPTAKAPKGERNTEAPSLGGELG